MDPRTRYKLLEGKYPYPHGPVLPQLSLPTQGEKRRVIQSREFVHGYELLMVPWFQPFEMGAWTIWSE